jgi:ABC-type spermidine/putrescine transport system permease subunit I
MFLGGPNDRMIANAIENMLLVQLQAPRAAALTLVLMALDHRGGAVAAAGMRRR